MEYIKLPIDAPAWADYVAGHPEANIFHHPAWSELLSECYGYRPAVVVALKNGHVCAGMPVLEVYSPLTGRRWISLPFTDGCPPLWDDGQARAGLTAYLRTQHHSGAIPRVEVRAEIDGNGVQHTQAAYYLHTMHLAPDLEAQYALLDKSMQRNTIQARQRGVWVKQGCTQADLMLFYDLMMRTRQRLGVPTQPKRFFQLLWKRIVARGLGHVLLAYAGEEPVAGGVLLYYGRTVMFKYAASDSRFWSLRPNNLLFWSVIEWGCRMGFDTLDFGRTESDNEGLRRFKLNWGAIEVPLVYSFIGGRSRDARMWSAQRALGILIRHSRPIVSRFIGELLYAHFA